MPARPSYGLLAIHPSPKLKSFLAGETQRVDWSRGPKLDIANASQFCYILIDVVQKEICLKNEGPVGEDSQRN